MDYLSAGIGAGLVIIFWVFMSYVKKKPKHDLHNLKKLVYDSGIKSLEVYKNQKELEEIFKQLEMAK